MSHPEEEDDRRFLDDLFEDDEWIEHEADGHGPGCGCPHDSEREDEDEDPGSLVIEMRWEGCKHRAMVLDAGLCPDRHTHLHPCPICMGIDPDCSIEYLDVH